MKYSFLLLHGAWHGSWCWHKIAPRLANAGHAVIAPDLIGPSLAAWTDALGEILAAQSTPVVLVGHSRAGIVISQAAERLPDKIKQLVYLSSFLLRQGESVLRVLRKDGGSPLLQAVSLSEDKAHWELDPGQVRSLFYSQCSDDDFKFAQSHLIPEPAEPLMTPVKITAGNFGRVPRAYIHCLRDRAIPIELQKSMVAASPCEPLYSLDTDHSPFFSKPDELTAYLLQLAACAPSERNR